MLLSRRAFLTAARPTAAPYSAAVVAERGREAAQAAAGREVAAPPTHDLDPIRLDSNENPLGPGARAMEHLVAAFEHAGRYPRNARPSSDDLRDRIARKLQVRPENVVVGNGSGELLRIATRVYVSSSRQLITASPSFESPERIARQIGLPVTRVPVDAAGRIDVDAMAEAAPWAGLVFLCNPNNPTATAHSFKTVADFVARVRRESPGTAILVDEAYYEYADDPGYGTALALALEHPDVFVTRTLSKAYGMAGLRIGYAVGQARTIEGLRRWIMASSRNSLAQAAAVAALEDQDHIDREHARNSEVRAYTRRFFDGLGIRTTESQTNFVFAEIGRPAGEFGAACARAGVRVGRAFPPLEKSWARISLGTMDEMKRATAVFAQVLSAGTARAPSPGASVAAE